MAQPILTAAGGWQAIRYVFKKGREAGGIWKLYQRMRSKNVCKTCALGMGGQEGGMVNEVGRFPEVCKKSVQAQAGDMAGTISEDFIRYNSLQAMGRLNSAEFEQLGRIAFPMIAEPHDTHFRRVSWDEALDRAGDAFRQAGPDETFWYSSGRASNEAAFLMQLVARAYGTNNVNNCSYYCHQASGVALTKVYGSGTSSVSLDDVEKADLALIAGANPPSNHPRLLTLLMQLKRRGGKVIAVNPLKELGLVRFKVPSDTRSMLLGTEISDLYLQPHVGTDLALFKALLKGLIESPARVVDEGFVQNHTVGWEQVKADVEATPWTALTAACGVPKEQIDEAVRMLITAKRGIFLWAMGLTHHVQGVENILALANVAMALGWLGKEGCGLLPIRGHSNVQGVGTVGVTPALKEAFARQMEQLYGIPAGRKAGMDTYSSMVAAHEGKVRAALLLGGNLFGSNPDRAWSGAALRKIGTTVAISTKMNEGHVHGRGQTAIVLPCLARDEESQPTTQESMFNFVRLSEGGTPSVEGEMRSEVEILASIAERVLAKDRFDWKALRSHESLRKQIAEVVPGMSSLAAIGPTKREFSIPGRVLHGPEFKTADGKAHFHVTPLPAFAPKAGEFRLMTLRSEGQFNTVVYDEEDIYRGNTRRDVVMMADEDAKRLKVEEGSQVAVETESGRMEVFVAIVDIRAGNLAMYYPEANILVPQKIDPQSRTPAFKSVIARVTPIKTATPPANPSPEKALAAV